MKKRTKEIEKIVMAVIFSAIVVIGTYLNVNEENKEESNKISYEISDIPTYSGKIYVEINNNIPKFSNEDMSIEKDYYSNLKSGKVRNSYDKNKLEKSK